MVFENCLIGMAILDSKGIFIRLNPKACEIWEYKEEELIGKHWKDITVKEDLDISSHFVESYKNKSSKFHMTIEKRYNTGCGNIKTCKITTSPLRNDNGEIEYFITQIEDITHKKAAISSIQKGIVFLRNFKK